MAQFSDTAPQLRAEVSANSAAIFRVETQAANLIAKVRSELLEKIGVVREETNTAVAETQARLGEIDNFVQEQICEPPEIGAILAECQDRLATSEAENKRFRSNLAQLADRLGLVEGVLSQPNALENRFNFCTIKLHCAREGWRYSKPPLPIQRHVTRKPRALLRFSLPPS